MAWRVISMPQLYKYARRFDVKSLFGFRLSGPDRIMVEPTSHCNLQCIMCGRTHFPQPHGSMELQVYKKLIDQIRVSITIDHLGFGEPLLHPDILEMIRYSAERKMKPLIITNGMLLTDEMSRALLQAGLTSIWISLDGVRKETFERIRPGAVFETVVGNIADLVKIREELGRKEFGIGIGTVPMSSNLKELPDLARLAIKLKVDRLEVHRFERASKAVGQSCIPTVSVEEDPYKPELKKLLSEAFCKLDEISRSTGFPITRPPEESNLLFRLPRRCPMPFTFPVITREGYVMPCFCFGDPREINMGNIKEKPFYVIWNDKPFRDFRESLLSQDPHPRCKRCRIFHGISQLWCDYAEIK